MTDTIISLTVNAPRTLLATVWKNSNHVSLWKINKLTAFSEAPIDFNYHSNINKLISKDKREFYFKEDAKGGQADPDFGNFDQEFYEELENAFADHSDDDEDPREVKGSSSTARPLKTFCEIPINRWINLLDIEIIKEKNKASKEQAIEVPFFLDFDNPLNRIQKETEGTLLEDSKVVKSKIIKNVDTKKYLDELGTPLEKSLGSVTLEERLSKTNRNILKSTFEDLKNSGASFIDYQIKTACFNSMENVIKLLMMFSVVIKKPDNFDIKNAIFKNFLEVSVFGLKFSRPVMTRLMSWTMPGS
jgi:hypothetical protein